MATKFETKSFTIRLEYETSLRPLRPSRGFGLFNDITQILPRPPLVAMATKFETKLAITQLVREISPRCLRLVEVFRDRVLLNDARQILSRLTLVAMATKLGTKLAIYNSACIRDI